ncbi:MAG: hypothetical protein KBD37_06825 [Burkholderiales bacterium]|nr:hypothetical protein [Burkholderiales bacterium]
MHNYQIPLIYFPLKLVFVDDNLNMLNSTYSYFKDKYRCERANSADEAIEIINKLPHFSYNLFTYETNREDDLQVEDNFKKFSLNIDNILNLVENTDRYNNVGIVVTDYKMGTKNGLELCGEIKNKYIKKILLTGQLDAAQGINAMNKQIIDRYVKKGSDSIIQDLKEYIEILHTAYFNQLSALNNDVLLNSDLYVLDDYDYIELFEKIVQEHKIKEFYLIDSKGSFLMIDEANEKFVLNVHTNKSLDEFIEIYQDEKHISSLIDGIKSRKLIPFFGVNINPASIELSRWYNHFYHTQTFKNFFWNWVKL